MRPSILPAAVMTAVLLAVTSSAAPAQQAILIDRPDLRLDDIPTLPALKSDSPRDTLLFADRFVVSADANEISALAFGTPTLVDVQIPSEVTGTGFNEILQYQLPADYDPEGSARPLVVAYHGFGMSANSVQLQSTIDEWCNSYGWIYMAPTGIDDKLFGSPISQQNVEAAIQFMLDDFNVDPDRIYLVGFSMGGGVVGNFSSRHRDADEIMIAAVATVSGSFDWTMAWFEDPASQPWLENPFNFGDTPGNAPFAYQQASNLHHLSGSYPPFPGSIDITRSMAHNLVQTPTWVTWDTGDSLAYLPSQSSNLQAWLGSQGADTTAVPVSGTTDPGTGLPATHSWAVLDEEALFTWLDGRVVDRSPSVLAARFDEDRAATWLDMTRSSADAFSDASGTLDLVNDQATVVGVTNADVLAVEIGDTGLSLPARVTGVSTDAEGFTLMVRGGVGYLTDPNTGSIVAGQEYAIDGGGAGVQVDGFGTADVTGIAVDWAGTLNLLPDPAPPGATVTLTVDGPAEATATWLLVGTADEVASLPGGEVLLVAIQASTLFIPLPLDVEGNVRAFATLPSSPSISGARLVLQAAFVSGAGLDGISNAFAFDVE